MFGEHKEILPLQIPLLARGLPQDLILTPFLFALFFLSGSLCFLVVSIQTQGRLSPSDLHCGNITSWQTPVTERQISLMLTPPTKAMGELES